MHFQFETHALYPSLREIWCGGDLVQTEPKAFDLMLHLVRNRDRVVEKDELIDAIWDGRAISDATLSSTVKAARRALGDTGARQALIRTIHGRGFRFVGDVREVRHAEAEAPLGSDAAEDVELDTPDRPSVAVLPFDCFGAMESHFLSHGVTQDITIGLARTRWLFVSSGASVRRLADAALDWVEVARRLGVRYVLRGSVQQAGGRFRISAALSDTETGAEIWADSFDRTLDDIFEVQSEIANSIVAGVESEIDLRERRRAILRPIESLDAWTAYHRATDLLFRFSTERLDEAESLLNLAARLDPGFARVPAAQSFLHWQRAFLNLSNDRATDVQRSRDFAEASLVLDPHDPQGHWALGRAAILGEDFDAAVTSLFAAVELNPNFANGYYSLAYAQMLSDTCAAGIPNVSSARRISPYDPMSFAFLSLMAELLAFEGKYDEAAVWARRSIRQPNAHAYVFVIAGWVLELARAREEAFAALREARRLNPDVSRTEFLRSFPFRGVQRNLVEGALDRIGF